MGFSKHVNIVVSILDMKLCSKFMMPRFFNVPKVEKKVCVSKGNNTLEHSMTNRFAYYFPWVAVGSSELH